MKSFDELFPEKAKERQEFNAKIKAQQNEDRQLFDSVFSSENGEKALKRIMQKCRYQKPNGVFTTDGQERVEILRRYEAQREVYLWLRQFVNNETLKRVEIGD